MASQLSSLLVKKQIVDVATMEKAFRRRELNGGSLGTSLLELEAIDERVLLRYLSLAHDIPAVPERWISDIDRAVVRVLSADDVARFAIVPVALDAEALAVAVSKPRSAAEVEAIEARIGRPIREYVLPEFRLEYLAHTLYGLPLTPRMRALAERFPRSVATSGLSGSFVQITPGFSTGRGHEAPTTPSGPWTVESLGRFLAKCSSRDHILQAVLAFIGNTLPRRFVLAVQQSKVRGFVAEGFGASVATVRAIEFEAKEMLEAFGPGRGVTSKLGHIDDLGVAPFYEVLNVSPPAEVFCSAIHIGPHPALFVVGDNRDDPIPRASQPVIELVITQAAAALMGLVRQKKLQQSAEHTAVSSGFPAEIAKPGEKAPEIHTLDAGWVLSTGVRGSVNVQDVAEQSLDANVLGTPLETTRGTLLDPATASDPPGIEYAPVEMGSNWPKKVELTETLPFLMTPIESLPQTLGSSRGGAAGQENELALLIEGQTGDPKQRGSQPRKTPTTWPSTPGADGFTSPVSLVAAVLSDDPVIALQARAELLLAGSDVLSTLMNRFPGPVRKGLPLDAPIAERGPLLAAIVDLGRRAVPHLIQLLQSGNNERRYYAVLCFREIRHDDAIIALAERALDPVAEIRRAVRTVLVVYRENPNFGQVHQILHHALGGDSQRKQIGAAEAVAALSDVAAVPLLLENVASSDPEVATTTQSALETLVFQNFGSNEKKWNKWHKKHGRATREQWLVASAIHKSLNIRSLVAEYISQAPNLDIEYDPTGKRREHKRAQTALMKLYGLGKYR